MAETRRFIQFPHPGQEQTYARGCKWSCNGYPHRRKFMQLHGKWIDEITWRSGGNGTKCCAPLWAWGEWEPESKRLCKLNASDQQYPNHLWEPYYIHKPNCRGLHNTDPFVFGDKFLYSNCRQTSIPGLRQLDRGSVIAFGSGKQVNGERKWMLDTVLVVNDFIDYEADNARIDLKGWVPDTFHDVTGSPLSDNPRDEDSSPGTCIPGAGPFRLYCGATPADRVEGMFSFFPAMPGTGSEGFPRPFIDLGDEYFDCFNPSNWRAVKGLRVEPTIAGVRKMWNCIVEQVLSKGCVLGTFAEEPRCQ